MPATIRLLGGPDFAPLFAHICRHADESGRDGDVIFRPRSQHEVIDELAVRERHRVAWARSLAEPGWMRTWGLVVEGAPARAGSAIVGHLDLTGGRVPAELHRATLGMGIERRARGQGHGRALLDAAIAWARQHGLAWLDLGVFAHNARARAVYRRAGFVEVGTVRDQFRVDGVAIDDVTMTLAL